MEKVLIIWNQPKSNKTEQERKLFFINQIIKPLGIEELNADINHLQIANDYSSLFNEDNSLSALFEEPYKAIIVRAGLTWDNRSPESNYGFKIIELLRLNKILCPVFLASPMPYKEMRERAEFLKVPGHYYIQLPKKEEAPVLFTGKETAIKNIPESLLWDINTSVFTTQGLITEIIHEWKNKVRAYPADVKDDTILRDADEYLLKIKQELSYFSLDFFEEEKTELKKEIPNYKNIIPLIDAMKKRLFAYYFQDDEANEKNTGYKNREWQVLVVDDDLAILEMVSKGFASQGVSCISADSGQKALEILEQDMKGELLKGNNETWQINSITVVVTDVRFVYENGDWHYYQGYNLLDKIYKTRSNLVSFFILTSKEGHIQKAAGKQAAFRFYSFSKSILDSQASFDFFADRVIEEGNRKFEELLSKPSGKNWGEPYKGKFEYPLKEYYRYWRMRSDYEEREKKISDWAWSIISDIRNTEDLDDFTIGKALPLRGGLKGHPSQSDKWLKNFELKLLGRRILFGLWKTNRKRLAEAAKYAHPNENLSYDWDDDLIDKLSLESIALFLGTGSFNESDLIGAKNDSVTYEERIKKYHKLIDEYKKQIINSHLCASADIEMEMEEHLLVEEREWVEGI